MNNRRSFIKSLLAGMVAPLFLPGAGRIWRPVEPEFVLESPPFTFGNYREMPWGYYDELILCDIPPNNVWLEAKEKVLTHSPPFCSLKL